MPRTRAFVVNTRALVIGCSIAFFASTSARAVVVYSNDFNNGSTMSFTGGSIQTAPSGEKFLGPFAQGGAATLSLAGLQPYTSGTLSFTLDVVGSMDGDGQFGGGPDPFLVSYNGSNIFNNNFANYGGNTQNYPFEPSQPGTGAATINALNYSGFPNSGNNIQDSEYNFTLAFTASSASTASFVFTGNTSEGVGNEFYGIDNVVVSTNGVVSGVPEPSTWAMMLLGFGGLGLFARQKIRRGPASQMTAA